MTKKNLKILIISFMVTILSACGGMSDAGKVLRNEKITNTDEFLVKKRAPLILPPDYDTIPKPKSIKEINQNTNDGKKISEILKIQDNEIKSSSQATSAEKSILNEIKK